MNIFWETIFANGAITFIPALFQMIEKLKTCEEIVKIDVSLAELEYQLAYCQSF